MVEPLYSYMRHYGTREVVRSYRVDLLLCFPCTAKIGMKWHVTLSIPNGVIPIKAKNQYKVYLGPQYVAHTQLFPAIIVHAPILTLSLSIKKLKSM